MQICKSTPYCGYIRSQRSPTERPPPQASRFGNPSDSLGQSLTARSLHGCGRLVDTLESCDDDSSVLWLLSLAHSAPLACPIGDTFDLLMASPTDVPTRAIALAEQRVCLQASSLPSETMLTDVSG